MTQFSETMSRAVQIVATKYAGAQFGEVTFRPVGPSGNAASDFTTWHFVFSVDQFRVLLTFANGAFEDPTELPGMLMGDRFLSLPFAKRLEDAFEILRGAGEKGAIEFVRLQHTLSFSPSASKEPSYKFHFVGSPREVHVGSETGAVRRLDA